jgi:hypothetical protein
VGSFHWPHALPPPPPLPADPVLPQAKSCQPRSAFLAAFPQTFDSLLALCADSDAGVQSAAAFLDNLVKARLSGETACVSCLHLLPCLIGASAPFLALTSAELPAFLPVLSAFLALFACPPVQ